jgi:hypothetical protein
MPKRRDVVAEQLRSLADDLENLWRAATRDPNKEARRERAWTVVSGVAAAAATMASRKLLAKLWPILTGETPPSGRGGGGRPQPRPERTASRADTAPESETRTAV